jgi:hypothetical protein
LDKFASGGSRSSVRVGRRHHDRVLDRHCVRVRANHASMHIILGSHRSIDRNNRVDLFSFESCAAVVQVAFASPVAMTPPNMRLQPSAPRGMLMRRG